MSGIQKAKPQRGAKGIIEMSCNLSGALSREMSVSSQRRAGGLYAISVRSSPDLSDRLQKELAVPADMK